MSVELPDPSLCLSEYSTTEELDLLFNSKNGILADDTFIGIMGDGNDEFGIDKAFDADDLFSLLETDRTPDTTHLEANHDHPYSKDQQLSRSPLNSDSGISDSCQRSPYSDFSQSEPSPGRSDDDGSNGGNLEDVIFDESIDLSCVLTGNDAMLMDDSGVSVSAASPDSTQTIIVEAVGFSNNLRLTASESKKETLPLTIHNVQTITPPEQICDDIDSKYHLTLTDEEKRLLNDMNVTLPTDMPLTKSEERSLKAVRRKIRNKASAMNSRKRKKEYVDGLEHRVQLCTRHNLELQKKMDKLEKDNRTLLDQLKGLQRLVTKSTNKAAQASTCVMVLLFSFALLVAPSFNPFSGSTPETYEPNGVVSRTLKHADIGDEGLVHEEVGLAGPPQSYADENPKMLGRRSIMTQTQEDFSLQNEDVKLEKQTTEEEKISDAESKVVMPMGEKDVKTVVNQPNENQRNNSQTVVVDTNNVKEEKIAMSNVDTNHVEVKSNPKVKKHAGDEM